MKDERKFIKTYDELDEIEDEAYRKACQGDLFFVRHAFGCIDGYFLIISRDDTLSMSKGGYILDYDDFEKWTDKEKELFRRHYGFEREAEK